MRLSNIAAAAPAAALAFAVLAVAAAPSAAAAACKAEGDAVALTVAGPAVAQPNRPPFSETFDRLHSYRGNRFDKARAFTLSDLSALPSQTVRVFSTYESKVVVFTGPALDDVLKAAGATAPKSVVLQALDGYEVKLDPALLAADKQVLALCREGVPLPLGGMGPVFSAIPLPAGQNTATEDQINRQVWGLFYIVAE